MIVDTYGEPGGSILNKMVRTVYGTDQDELNYRGVEVRMIKNDRWTGAGIMSEGLTLKAAL